MALIECLNLRGGILFSNSYKTSKGNKYDFFRGTATKITDKEDIEFFLKAGGGKSFARKDTVGKAQEVVDKVKEKVTGKKSPQQEAKEEVEKATKILTYDEIKALDKNAQIDKIKKLGGGNIRIPRYEKDRIELIQKLQGSEKSEKTK